MYKKRAVFSLRISHMGLKIMLDKEKIIHLL